MANIPFATISQSIKARLETGLSQRHNDVKIVIEQEFQPLDSWITINFRDVSTVDGQPLSASTRQRIVVAFSVWCWRFSFDKNEATKARDDLLGDCELALMLDRTMNGAVTTSWLEGGQFNRAEDPQNIGRFFLGGEILLSCEYLASNI